MRDLARPDTVKSAAIAAAVGALACVPRFLQWEKAPQPLWYLVSLLLLGGFVFWAFVFAWHERYTQRPVFKLKGETIPLVIVTGLGLGLAFLCHRFLEPALREQRPDEFPKTLGEWAAGGLFNLAFMQLFLVFAPFDWAMRLGKQTTIAFAVVSVFGALVIAYKLNTTPGPLSTALYWWLLLARVVTSLATVWLYARHGLIVASWWTLLLYLRFLPG